MKLSFVFGLLIMLSTLTYSQDNSLWVSHPQKWLSGQGTIESAVWVVRPKGNFASCDLYMTFSAKGLGFWSGDSFEVSYRFTLPENAVVNDLWLWVRYDIMRALHMDRWTASSIYEGIVKRRRDPCLLIKYDDYYGSARYEARIYPLMGTDKRKIKLSYTVPIQWTVSGPMIEIPRNLLTASQTMPMMRIRVIPDTSWPSPRLRELSVNPFVIVEDSIPGPVYQCDLSASLVTNTPRLTLTFNKSLRDGYLLQWLPRKEENYYHMAIVPGLVFPAWGTRRVAVLLDLDSANARMGTSVFVSRVKSFMLSKFTEKDSFNIFYNSVSGERRASAGWFVGTVEGINAAFDSIKAEGGPRYKVKAASLSGLLAMGLDFVHQKNNGASILVVTSSTECMDYRRANEVLAILRPWLSYGIPVNIAEFAHYPWDKYIYLDGQAWYGNQYFNKNIAQSTGGAYFYEYDYSTPTAALDRVLASIEPYVQTPPEAFDVAITPAGGLTYQRCNPAGKAAAPVTWGRSVQESGKFVGGFPFTVNVSALYRGQMYVKSFTIDASSALSCDSTLVQHWAGNYIDQVLTNSQSSLKPNQILALSLEQRVLSNYSAFLALEPNDTLKACLTCKDESGPPLAVKTKDAQVSADTLVQVYPNPFNSSTRISVRLPKGVKPEQARVGLFNVLGQQVRTFDPGVLSSAAVHAYTWDGTNDQGKTVSSGVYFFTLSSPRGIVTTRLLMTK